MSPEIGSLDDVVRDDRICTALGERRFDEVPFDDELSSTMASWCQDLDFGLDAFADELPTPDLAKAAARRRAMQRGGRLVGAAAAVAAVCVGGLAVTHLTSSSNSNGTQPAKTGAVSTPSLENRQQVWRDLSSARDALIKQDWSTARKLLASASASLPAIAPEDGHDALQTWVNTLNTMLNNHTTIEPTASLGTVRGDNSTYVVDDQGVPMLPGMENLNTTAPDESTLPHHLPPLPPLTVPTTGKSTATVDDGRDPHTRQESSRGGQATAGQGTGTQSSASNGSSAPGGSSSAPGSSSNPGSSAPGSNPSSSTPPSSSRPPSNSNPPADDEPPLPPAPQIRINAPLLKQLLPQQPTAPSTSPSSLPSSSSAAAGTTAGGSTTAAGTTGAGTTGAGTSGAASTNAGTSSAASTGVTGTGSTTTEASNPAAPTPEPTVDPG